MKKGIVIIISLIISVYAVQAQKSYRTTDSEMIFSMSDVKRNGVDLDSEVRWTMFYHTAGYNNHDITGTFGLFYGLALRNVGFITQDEVIGLTQFSTVKRRSYSLGLPVGIKIGDLDSDMFIFGGAEYEWMFHYKEKRFEEGEKVSRETDWFSKKTNRFVPSLYFGLNFKTQLSVTFKYYLNDMMNRSFRDPATGLRPYSDMDSRIFYISVSKKFRYNRLKEIVKVQGLSI
ncbi:MAG: hypothetical protein IH591_02425 [Bacteroidales bacterium]|nr:hypothetical protein [Bacteroidales bacterium]